MKHVKISINYNLILIILLLYGYKDNIYFGSFIVENSLNEGVKIEGYYIPFDYPNQPMEKGEFTLEKMESLLLYESSYEEQEAPSAFNALRIFLGIQGVDSVVFTFEDNSHLSYNQNDLSDSKNLLLGPNGIITGWTTKEVDKNRYNYTFRVSESHKEAAK